MPSIVRTKAPGAAWGTSIEPEGGASGPVVVQGRWPGASAGGDVAAIIGVVPGTASDAYTVESVSYYPDNDISFGNGASFASASNNALTICTKGRGTVENDHQCVITDPGAPNQALAISYDSGADLLTILLGTDAGGLTSFGDDVYDVFDNPANPLYDPAISAIFVACGAGHSHVIDTPQDYFIDGADASRYYHLMRGSNQTTLDNLAERDFIQSDRPYPDTGQIYDGLPFDIPVVIPDVVGGDCLWLESGQVFGQGAAPEDLTGGIVIVTLAAA